MTSKMLWFLILAIFIPISMSENTNLAAIRWAHAVNSQDLLKSALDNNDIDAIEADVIIGTLTTDPGNGNKIPVMGHPPLTSSDLSLEQFLKDIKEHNAKNPKFAKLVKLDFKSIEAVTESVNMMERDWKEQYMNIPVWINADIIDGPDGDGLPIPVDDKKFFEAAKRLERPTLSIGWTTPKQIGATQGYTSDHVKIMIKSIQDNQISKTCPITFPVRAALVINSSENLKYLYEEISKQSPTTFTIWSAVQDKVDAKRLQAFIDLFGVDKVYVDVPDELRNELDLN